MKEALSTNNKLFISGKVGSIVRRLFFQKMGIEPNCNSRHELVALFQVLLYMFGNELSAEEAVIQLKIELSDSLVASADTLLRRLKEADEKLVQKAFNSTVRRFLKHYQKKNCTIAIDFHDIPYYGDKNDCHVRGTKRKNGTNYCHQFATLEIVDGEQRFTLAVKKLSLNDDENSKIIQELIQTAKKHVIIDLILLDRGFYAIECIRVLKHSKFKFVIPVRKDKKMVGVMNEQKLKFPIVIPYTIGDEKKNHETFNLCLKWKETKKDELPDVIGFATNIVNPDVEWICEQYKKRWSIETGYRSKKKFRVKTTTTNNTVRLVYFYFECLLYNTWYSLKNQITVTICSFKKIIEKTVTDFFQNQKNST